MKAGNEIGGSTEDFWKHVQRLKVSVLRVKGLQVESGRVREDSKAVVQRYFRQFRAELSNVGADTSLLDEQLQGLLALSNARSAKSSYRRVIGAILKLRNSAEIARELSFTAPPPSGTHADKNGPDEHILKTLQQLLPASALAYRQALLDVADENRLSYRGAATELREVLREVIDHLAPDKEVLAQEGFKLVEGRSGPTITQKVSFILKSRSVKKNAIATATSTVALIEEGLGKLARSVYSRGSESAHGQTNRKEVAQIRRYVDVLLFELLALSI